MTYTYRICSKCRKMVNVSRQEKHGKKYICPRCTGEPWYMTREGLVREHTQGKGVGKCTESRLPGSRR